LMIVRADDTPAQAAARAALEQKLNELATQPSAAPPIVVTPSGAKVETPAPVVVVPPVAPAPAPVPAPGADMVQPTPAPAMAASPASDSEAQAKARAALLQKMSEIDTQPAATPPLAPEKVVVQQMETPAAVAPVAAPVETKSDVVVEPVVKPMETPALPISATKEERLQALLEKYKADQITPEEYHTERAKIIGEP
jgi:hypothetical protein